MTYPPKDYYDSPEHRRAIRRDLRVLLALALLIVSLLGLIDAARADVRAGTYELRADGPLYRQHRAASCGATRFLRERLRLTWDGATARLGVTQLDVLDDDEGALLLGRGRHPSKTLLSLGVWQVGEDRLAGEYVLFGFRATYAGDPYFPHGRPCEDRVRLVGRKLK